MQTDAEPRENPGVRGKNGCYIVRPVQAGQKFGRLTAIEFIRIRNGNPGWLCRCDCGNMQKAVEWCLWNGFVRSCGCYRDEKIANIGRAQATHSMSYTRVYKAWRCMKQRCSLPSRHDWMTYGGRGIRVCERWAESFQNFYSDMGDPPSRRHSLDRIDSNGNYSPENCRWATWAEQGENKRNTRWITAFGKTLTLKKWAQDPLCKTSWYTLCARIKAGWPAEEAIGRPTLKFGEWNSFHGRSKIGDAVAVIAKMHNSEPVGEAR